MSKPALKPCPFCGGDDLDLMETDSGLGGLEGWYYVTCWFCGAEGGKEETKKEAKMLWNSRHNQNRGRK